MGVRAGAGRAPACGGSSTARPYNIDCRRTKSGPTPDLLRGLAPVGGQGEQALPRVVQGEPGRAGLKPAPTAGRPYDDQPSPIDHVSLARAALRFARGQAPGGSGDGLGTASPFLAGRQFALGEADFSHADVLARDLEFGKVVRALVDLGG